MKNAEMHLTAVRKLLRRLRAIERGQTTFESLRDDIADLAEVMEGMLMEGQEDRDHG